MASPLPGPTPASNPTIAYKILTISQYNSWLSSPKVPISTSSYQVCLFTGAGIDLQDNYIHLSTASQAGETYSKYFASDNLAERTTTLDSDETAPDKGGAEWLVVVEIDLTKVIGEVKWELAPKRGEEFAHVYGGGIPFVPKGEEGEELSAVRRVWKAEIVRQDLFDAIATEAVGE